MDRAILKREQVSKPGVGSITVPYLAHELAD